MVVDWVGKLVDKKVVKKAGLLAGEWAYWLAVW